MAVACYRLKLCIIKTFDTACGTVQMKVNYNISNWCKYNVTIINYTNSIKLYAKGLQFIVSMKKLKVQFIQ